MKIVIVGCGRVGSTLAENLDASGHDVIIFDIKTSAFDRLPETFKGAAVRGDGTDEEVLRRNGVAGADIFLSLTEGDNRNVMAAQVAAESFDVGQVIAKINDPVRAAAYAELGVVTLCRTNLMVDSVAKYLTLPMQTGPGIDVPTSPIHEHPHPTADDADDAERPATVSGAARSGAAPSAPPAPSDPSDPAPAAPAGAASGVKPSAAGDVEITNEADKARAQRLGFRRWRG